VDEAVYVTVWTVTVNSLAIGEGDVVEITYNPASDC